MAALAPTRRASSASAGCGRRSRAIPNRQAEHGNAKPGLPADRETGGRCTPHPTYISQLERELKSPTLRVFRGLAEALGTSGAELLRKAESAA